MEVFVSGQQVNRNTKARFHGEPVVTIPPQGVKTGSEGLHEKATPAFQIPITNTICIQ